jgi:hypothetical protein
LSARPLTSDAVLQTPEEFRAGGHGSDKQLIPSAGACTVKEISFCLVDVLQVGVVADLFELLLRRNDLVVARHDHDRPKLESLGEVHRANRDASAAYRQEPADVAAAIRALSVK